MTDTETRPLRRMLERISLLKSGAISLVQGADDLLSLRDMLDEFDAFGQAWFDTFTSHVVTLESAGVASAGKVLPRQSPLEPYVSDALDHLDSLIRRPPLRGRLAGQLRITEAHFERGRTAGADIRRSSSDL